MDWWLNTWWAFLSSGLWIQHWHVGASLADSCCAVFQVACLTSFFLSNVNTQSLLLLFQCHCPVWCSVFSFHLLVSIPLFFYICIPMLPSCLPLPHPFCLSVVLSTPIFPPWCPAFYSAAPLTSAGIIPIMQSLCPDGQRDEFGFLQYKNSTWVDFVSKYLSVS